MGKVGGGGHILKSLLARLSATCYSTQRNESHQVVPLEIKMIK